MSKEGFAMPNSLDRLIRRIKKEFGDDGILGNF